MIYIQKLHDPQIEVHDSMIEAHGAVSSDRFHELCSSWRNTRDYSHGELRTKPAGLVVFSAAFDKPVSAKENTTSSRGRLYTSM